MLSILGKEKKISMEPIKSQKHTSKYKGMGL